MAPTKYVNFDSSAALQALGNPVVVVDRDCCIVFSNRAADVLLGYGRDSPVDTDFFATHRHSFSDGKPRQRSDCAIVRSSSDGVVHEDQHTHVWRIDGTSVAVEYAASPWLVSGLLQGAVLALQDTRAKTRLLARQDDAVREVREALTAVEAERDYLRGELRRAKETSTLVVNSGPMKRAMERLGAAGLSPAPVLLFGGPGTDKVTVARWLHEKSFRQDRAFVMVRCSQAGVRVVGPGGTGARGREDDSVAHVLTRALRLAHGGTLVLAGVDRLPLEAQRAVLKVLDEGVSVGLGRQSELCDVRLVSTASEEIPGVDLGSRFDSDFAYRVGVLTVPIPSLRERLDDLEDIVRLELEEICAGLGRSVPQLSKWHFRRLNSYGWPGNLDELRAVLTSASVGSTGERLRLDALPKTEAETPTTPRKGTARTEEQMRALERENLVLALTEFNGLISGPDGAARALGLKPSTFAYRVKVHGIKPTEYASSP
jgi:DNA-binding NtrC family response regulator